MIWVPPSAREATQRQRAELVDAARRDAVCDYWDRELKKIDPDLYLVKAHDDAAVPGLRPGYWHVVRDNRDAPPSILPLVGDDGEFVEPTSRLLEVLRAGDLQNARVMADRRARDEAEERALAKSREVEHEERAEEMMDRWRAATQTRVSLSRDVPWSQNVSGRRGARRKAE